MAPEIGVLHFSDMVFTNTVDIEVWEKRVKVN